MSSVKSKLRWLVRLSHKDDFSFIATLVVVWIGMVILVNPVGDFPLNDDWSYGRAVKSLLDSGHVRLTGWTYMTLMTQVFWGALFCLPFGFSFTALRISTLTAGLIGVLSTHGILRLVGARPKLAFVGALVVAGNPLYFQLSNTFMTDVPFFALSMISCFAFLRGLNNNSFRNILLGSLWVVAATLIRQIGIVIAMSFGLAYLVRHDCRIRTLMTASLPIVLTIGGFGVYQIWFEHTQPSAPNNTLEHVKMILDGLATPIRFVSVFMIRLAIIFVYLGLFTFPILLHRLPRFWKSRSDQPAVKPVWAALSFSSFLFLGFLTWKGRLMPLTGDILFDFGLGPESLRDYEILQLSHWPTAPRLFWFVVTTVGVLGSVFLVLLLYEVLAKWQAWGSQYTTQRLNKKPLMVFTISNLVLYIVPIAGISFLDRYLLFALPLLMVIVVLVTVRTSTHAFDLQGRLHTVIGSAVILLYTLFSITATHDYLASNRTRWQAANHLTQEKGVVPAQIDGGFEFNGWYLYDPNYERQPDKSWWWVDEDQYVIAFGPIDGYQEIQRYTFQRWLPPGKGNILILRRTESPPCGVDTKALPEFFFNFQETST